MGLEDQIPQGELPCSENKLLGVGFVFISKREELGSDPARLPSVFFLEDGSLAIPEKDRPIACFQRTAPFLRIWEGTSRSQGVSGPMKRAYS